MNLYGTAALMVAQSFRQGQNPEAEWEKAIKQLTSKTSVQEKACPKDAFLGLCTAGLVKNMPAGQYSSSVDNRAYAEEGVRLLKSNRKYWSFSKIQLWKEVLKTLKCNQNKRHNQ